jgi:hypothetical protein
VSQRLPQPGRTAGNDTITLDEANGALPQAFLSGGTGSNVVIQ